LSGRPNRARLGSLPAAALNAIQIAETLIKRNLIEAKKKAA
jgi:hypothetical protein